MNIASEYKVVYEAIRGADPEFAQALRQWQQHFCSTIYRLNKITGKDKFDLSQQILTELVRVRDTYRIPLYRFEGRLWEIGDTDGPICCLIKPRHNKLNMKPIWTSKHHIKPVIKGKLSSVIYREITQQYSDIIAAHFCVKYGFERVKEESKKKGTSFYTYLNKIYEGVKKEGNLILLKDTKKSFWVNSEDAKRMKHDTRLVTIRSGKRGTDLQRKKINKVKRFIEEVSLWEPIVTDSDTLIIDTIQNQDLNPEEILILSEMLGFIGKEKKYPVHDPTS